MRDRNFWAVWLGLVLCVSAGALTSAENRLHHEMVGAWQLAEGPERWRHEARLWFYAGTLSEDSDFKDQCFKNGKQAADELLKVLPKDGAGLFWQAANLSGQVEQAKNLWALSVLPEIEKTLTDLGKTDPQFAYGGAFRVLGVIYEAAPGFISIGSSRKAEAHLKRALEIAPQYPGNQLAWALWLEEQGREKESRRLWENLQRKSLNGDLGVFWPEQLLWQRDLAKLQERLGGGRS